MQLIWNYISIDLWSWPDLTYDEEFVTYEFIIHLENDSI